ncbi:MAG: flagellar biosynthesis anti-sigma factor FlgM [Deltaproteobacteria bacterium]|jgi:negative regulator of flagellin synthesis FlgM|nr:flagellar biosynthesis anti-sigma factor FlgM [Deltaproteobacteria bacterium]
MKLDSLNTFGINKPDKPGGASSSKALGKGNLSVPNAVEETQVGSGDTVKISDRSKLISKATELVNLAPDIRSERVAELTAQIAAGTYNVSSLDVADSIIKKKISGFI